VRPLADGVDLATGQFSLKRTAAGGGDASGRFTLVLKRMGAGWKIIHDHTS
jgi:ketosteroid isomerase-like protein